MDTYYPPSDAPSRAYTAPEPEIAPVMGFGDWLIALIVSLIPIVNIIVLLIWAFSNKTNPNRRNFALAALVLAAVYCVFLAMYIGYFAGMFYTVAEMLQ